MVPTLPARHQVLARAPWFAVLSPEPCLWSASTCWRSPSAGRKRADPASTTEVSAYYADVAANLASGHGLVSHSVWSYATGPLVVPKPAFELWLPMSSFVSALTMSILGESWWAAQVASALLGIRSEHRWPGR